MQFVIYRDNGAQYHWRLNGDDGTKLAVSAASFTTAEGAREAATDVRDGAVSAADIEG